MNELPYVPGEAMVGAEWRSSVRRRERLAWDYLFISGKDPTESELDRFESCYLGYAKQTAVPAETLTEDKDIVLE